MKKVITADGVTMLAERIAVYGESEVSDLELLTVAIGDAGVALELLGKFGSLARLCEAPRSELERSKLIRPAQLARVKVAAEIGRRIALGKSDEPPTFFRTTDDVIAYFQPRLADEKVEVMYLVLLDCRKRVRRVMELARGGINLLSIYPREVVSPALEARAHSFLLCHSHPSGDPTPSREDREFTQRVKSIGELIGIPLLDHVIVARTGGQSVL